MMNSSDEEFPIRARDLGVTRGGHRILDALDLTARRGRITGLLGPSGCGKTTLLRAIVGTQRHTGTLTVLGHPAGSRELRSRIGYVTQSPAVYPDLTAGENVSYFAALYGRSKADAGRALQTVDLAEHSHSRVRELSGGQAGRVSLACALVGEPDLLILDEPTVGLDPLLRRELWQRFRELATGGATLLISSHVMDEADRCDEILLMRAGAIIGAGSPAELRERTGLPDADDLSMDEVFLNLVTGSEAA